MTTHVDIRPGLLRWAQERSGHSDDWFAHRFAKLPLWLEGTKKPTLKQLEDFARATYTPVGFFFLPEPPVESVPIPDFRTVRNEHVTRPSPDLLDTVYLCQQRQEWYRDFARSTGEEPRRFVGSVKPKSNIEETAAAIRHALGFDLEERRQLPTWSEALRRFIEQADALGVLVMVNGIVGSNTHRKLDPQEFRGFALSDELAPLVFINGADSKSAQMFTLAHELAHLWLGESALSDVDPLLMPTIKAEEWCNRVAAELLVPAGDFRAKYDRHAPVSQETQRLATIYKVSTLVILRRMRDVGGLSDNRYWEAYKAELARLRRPGASKGGDFYRSQAARVGKRFARALVISTMEGQTLHRDAFRLLGFSKFETFQKLGHSLGVA